MNRPKKKGHEIVYIGGDSGYFYNIKQRFLKTYHALNCTFENFSPQGSVELMAQNLYLKLLYNDFKVIYIDFTENLEPMLYLAEMISRDPKFIDIPVVGLCDNKKATRECLGAGVDFIYVKGAEFHDLIFAPMSQSYPKLAVKPKFAKAKVVQDASIIDDFRVGFIAPTYIHVEGNLLLEEKEVIAVHSEIPRKNIPSKRYKVRSRSESNLYYDFNYGYDLDFIFVDEPEMSEDEYEDGLGALDESEKTKLKALAQKKRKARLEQHKEEVLRSQKKHKEWVVHNLDGKQEKKTKILIVDEKMRIFQPNDTQGQVNLAKESYSFRCQSTFQNKFQKLKKIRPALIAYQMMSDFGPEDEDHFQLATQILKDQSDINSVIPDKSKGKIVQEIIDSLNDREKQELSKLSQLIKAVKSIENYSPIIVLFRCYFHNSKALQETFQYPMLVTHSENISLDVILNLANIYETKQNNKMQKLIEEKVIQLKKKDPKKYARLKENDLKEKKYFIRKKNPLSYGSISIPIVIVSFTESEVVFRSPKELPMKTYRLDYPLPMSVRLVVIDEGKDFLMDKEEYVYRSIIHSISEVDKKQLRQLVNEVFFIPLKEKRDKELTDFEELNKKVFSEREKSESDDENSEADSNIEKTSQDGPSDLIDTGESSKDNGGSKD